MPIQQCFVARRPPGRMEGDEIERRGIGRTVIWRVRDQLEMSEFSVADFMQDLSRLGVTIIVAFPRLERAQNVECSAGEIRIDQHVL